MVRWATFTADAEVRPPSESATPRSRPRLYARFRCGVILLLTIVGGVVSAGAAEPARVFRAGAAKGDITPDLGIMIVGGTRPQPAGHIHDPLHVRVLVLDDGVTRIALATCDLLGVPPEIVKTAKQRIAEQSGLPGTHVMISGTHTHSAGSPYAPGLTTPDRSIPVVEKLSDYQQFVARRIADTVQVAINRLEPAKVGWGAGQEPSQVFNRRWYVKSEEMRRNPFGGIDQVRMNPPNASPELIEPAGPTDPEIVFVSVQTQAGRPLALLANYSLHYVGGVPAQDISADYFGMFAEKMEQWLGVKGADPGFVAIMTNGTSGDINNRNFRARRGPRVPYEKMRQVANAVAAEVYRAYQSVEHRDWVPLAVRYEDARIRSRKPTPEMVVQAQATLARPAGEQPETHARERTYARRVMELQRAPEWVESPLQAFRIGGLGIVTFPLEVFVEVGLEIKEKSPFEKTFSVSLANSYLGYMPTERHHQLGGYETWLGTNRLEVTAASQMTDVLLRFLRELHAESR